MRWLTSSLMPIFLCTLLSPAHIRACDDAEIRSTSTSILENLRATEFDQIVPHLLEYRALAEALKEKYPKVMWEQQEAELRASFVSSMGDSPKSYWEKWDAMFTPPSITSRLLSARKLLSHGAEWEILEVRNASGDADGKQSTAFVQVSYPDISVSPIIGRSFLSSLILELSYVGTECLLYDIGVVAKSRQYYGDVGPHVLSVRWTADSLGGVTLFYGLAGGSTPFTSRTSCAAYDIEKSNKARTSYDSDESVLKVFLSATIPDSAFPLGCSARITDGAGRTDEVFFTVPRYATGRAHAFCWFQSPRSRILNLDTDFCISPILDFSDQAQSTSAQTVAVAESEQSADVPKDGLVVLASTYSSGAEFDDDEALIAAPREVVWAEVLSWLKGNWSRIGNEIRSVDREAGLILTEPATNSLQTSTTKWWYAVEVKEGDSQSTIVRVICGYYVSNVPNPRSQEDWSPDRSTARERRSSFLETIEKKTAKAMRKLRD